MNNDTFHMQNPAGVMFQGQVPDESKEEGFLKELKVIEDVLLQNQYLAGNTMSIAGKIQPG